MCFANGRCLLCIAFLVLFAAAADPGSSDRVRAKKKVLALTPGERMRLLNELAEPFGFAYLPSEDIFTSRLEPGSVTRDMRRNMIPWRWVRDGD